MRPVNCDKYVELLSARLDGALSEPEERELEAHLASCPACRAASAQLAALRPAFSELEDLPAPEGLTQDVMDRIRAENKIVPLFRRPWFKAMAGLAACAALAVGLYGSMQRKGANDLTESESMMVRGFTQNAFEEDGDVPAGEISRSVPDFSTTAADPDTDTPSYDAAAVPAAPMSDMEVLVVGRMPEGGWELIPPETPVSADGLHVTGELLEQIQRLAQEQGITASLTSGTEGAELHLIVVLDETE